MINIILAVTLCVLFSASSNAQFSLNKSGFVINTNDGENSVIVTNTGREPILLYATESMDETKKISGKSLFYLSPPVSKIAPGESQIIRIIIKNKKIRMEQLARLLFQEVIPRKNFDNKAVITSAYNIAAVAHPSNLVENITPWKYLKIVNKNDHWYIVNNSFYVIRLVPSVRLLSGEKTIGNKLLTQSYILPKSKLLIGRYNFKNITRIAIRPVSQTAITLPEYFISMDNI